MRLLRSSSWWLGLGVGLVVGSGMLGMYSEALAKEYDGVWFFGFNLKREIPSKLQFRRGILRTISIEKIATKIISDEVVPKSIIPPGMSGYLEKLPPVKQNYKLAAELVNPAISGVKGKKKSFILLHTDGVKTTKIVEQIKADFKKVGLLLKLKQIKFSEQEQWIKAMQDGDHDLFLMGYKGSSAEKLLRGLFHSKGEANFTFYQKSRVDQLLNQLGTIKDSKLKAKKLKEINLIVFYDRPIIPLFYITRL